MSFIKLLIIFRQFRKKSALFVGYFEARSPKLFLIDPKVVRDVTITYFNNFRDSGFGKIVRITAIKNIIEAF